MLYDPWLTYAPQPSPVRLWLARRAAGLASQELWRRGAVLVAAIAINRIGYHIPVMSLIPGVTNIAGADTQLTEADERMQIGSMLGGTGDVAGSLFRLRLVDGIGALWVQRMRIGWAARGTGMATWRARVWLRVCACLGVPLTAVSVPVSQPLQLCVCVRCRALHHDARCRLGPVHELVWPSPAIPSPLACTA